MKIQINLIESNVISTDTTSKTWSAELIHDSI